MKTRRHIGITLLTLLVLAITITIVHTIVISPKTYRIQDVQVTNKTIPQQFQNFKIAYLSDIHLRSKKDITRLESIVKDLNEQSYQMVLFGGDLYEGKVFEDKKVTQILNSIHSSHGKFAVLGEEDNSNSSQVVQILNEAGFETLNNEARTIYYNEARIRLIGYNIEAAAALEKSDLYTLSFSHYPDQFAFISDTSQYHLAGHSGGGFIYLPLLGATTKLTHAKTYNHGRYTKKNAILYVSNGLSTMADHPYKFLAKNEIVMLTLTKS